MDCGNETVNENKGGVMGFVPWKNLSVSTIEAIRVSQETCLRPVAIK